MNNGEVIDIIEKISELIKENEHVVKITIETSKGTKIQVTNQDYKLYGN